MSEKQEEKEKLKMKLIQYSNGMSARFKNRRLTVYDTQKGNTCICLESVDKRRKKEAITEVHMATVTIDKGVKSTLEFGLSIESVEAFHFLLGEYLNERQQAAHISKIDEELDKSEEMIEAVYNFKNEEE